MNDITLVVQVITKIISGMFFTPEMVVILSIVAVAGIAFWVKARLDA
jgi:positive regulator of sigma E activity